MSDNEPTTNEKIAELLREQTYDERMEMAAWFRDVAADSEEELDLDWFANTFKLWADNELGEL